MINKNKSLLKLESIPSFHETFLNQDKITVYMDLFKSLSIKIG